jgi:thiol-disulfide isomerase/thioredoxin
MAKKMRARSKMNKTESRQNSRPEHIDDGISKTRIGIAVAILIVMILVIIFYNKIFPIQGDTVAIVNGEKITEKEFNSRYEPYKEMGFSEMDFLNGSLIPYKILLQEAKKQGMTANESEIENFINDVILANGVNQEEFEDLLKQQNLTYDEFRQLSKEQIMITKLLDSTLPDIEITEQEARDFYNSNKNKLNITSPFEEVKENIIEYLEKKEYSDNTNKLVNEIRSNIVVDIFIIDSSDLAASGISAGATKTEGSFSVSSDEICAEDGKPLVILFSTTTCPHCKWIKKTFDSVAKEYADSGKIAAYHWEMDSNDNTLTSAKESKVPDDYANMFWKYSNNGAVPTFVFGCRYYRLGNAYETSNDLASEEKEFRRMMDLLAAG